MGISLIIEISRSGSNDGLLEEMLDPFGLRKDH
jgi:hypothetical protein